MHLMIALCYNLETMKRTSRFVEVFDPRTDQAIESELPKRLLLPTKLPQEWLPAELRNGAAQPVKRWIDRSLFSQDSEEDIETAP